MNKLRHLILLTALVLATLLLTACDIPALLGDDGRVIHGSGNVVEETREVIDVSGVNLATIGDMVIELGDTESLQIEAEDNLIEFFETEVRNGKLIIGTKDNVRLNTTKPVKYTLVLTGLDTIEISSAGNIGAPDLQTEQFSIDINSSGNLEIGELIADTLAVHINSSGNLDIAGGEVKSQNITIGSSGNYTAQDLASDEADVSLSSNGSATIWVQENLKANLSSSGALRYRGNPSVDATTNSSGDVIQISE